MTTPVKPVKIINNNTNTAKTEKPKKSNMEILLKVRDLLTTARYNCYTESAAREYEEASKEVGRMIQRFRKHQEDMERKARKADREIYEPEVAQV